MLLVLDRHGVDYVLVGGTAAIAHGATRPTMDIDCVPARRMDNLQRLADAMRELGAYLRVSGLSADEARALPLQLDAQALARLEISTWATDAGDFDVLADIPTADGGRIGYDDLVSRASNMTLHGVRVRVAALPDVIASKEWANRPKDHEALPELRGLAGHEDPGH